MLVSTLTFSLAALLLLDRISISLRTNHQEEEEGQPAGGASGGGEGGEGRGGRTRHADSDRKEPLHARGVRSGVDGAPGVNTEVLGRQNGAANNAGPAARRNGGVGGGGGGGRRTGGGGGRAAAEANTPNSSIRRNGNEKYGKRRT